MNPPAEYLRCIQDYAAHHVKPSIRLAQVLLSGDIRSLLTVASESELDNLSSYILMIHGFVPFEAWGSLHAYNNWLSSGCAEHDGNPCKLCGYRSET